MKISPELGSQRRMSNCNTVDFPLPDSPTRPIFSPYFILRSNSQRTELSRSGYLKEMLRNSMLPFRSSFTVPPFSKEICSSSLPQMISNKTAPDLLALAMSGKCWLLCPIVLAEQIIAKIATKIAPLSSVTIPLVYIAPIIQKMNPSTITMLPRLNPWRNEIFKDRQKAILFNSCRLSQNFQMKQVLLPKDFTVRMLLTVSEINEPMNFYDLQDFEAMLLVIDTWMEVEIMSKGVKASVTSAIFQQCTAAMTKETAIVVELRQTTAMMPVIMLCIWYASLDNFVEIAPGVFYFLSKYRMGIFSSFSKTLMRRSQTSLSPTTPKQKLQRNTVEEPTMAISRKQMQNLSIKSQLATTSVSNPRMLPNATVKSGITPPLISEPIAPVIKKGKWDLLCANNFLNTAPCLMFCTFAFDSFLFSFSSIEVAALSLSLSSLFISQES